MKGITFVIILSIVWSIVSSIIEKRKAAAKKEAALGNLGGNVPTQKQTPMSVKVQSLRQRKKQVPITTDVEQIERGLEPILKLHKEDCPLPPKKLSQSAPRPARQIAALLSDRRNIRTAIVLTEILGKPVSQR
jgi:hypothetical protein